MTKQTPIGFLRAGQLAKYIGVSLTHFNDKIRTRRDFPKEVPLTGRGGVWSKDEVDQWMFSLRTKNLND